MCMWRDKEDEGGGDLNYVLILGTGTNTVIIVIDIIMKYSSILQ
jgi:hypothetical protein